LALTLLSWLPATPFLATKSAIVWQESKTTTYSIQHQEQSPYSPFLQAQISKLHEIASDIKIPKDVKRIDELNYLLKLYQVRLETPEEVGISNCQTLVYLAEKISNNIKKKISKKALAKLIEGIGAYNNRLGDAKITGAGGRSYTLPKWSNYYSQAVAKYGNVIRALKDLWTRNKYDWLHKHYGEIDWKNLIKVYMGEKLDWPVFLILAKILLFKNIYLAIDRSGSTSNIRDEIMDTAIIIAESLRQCNTPISIIDIGVEDKIVNDVNDPIDTTWFTPMSKGGTPIGEVCLGIKEKNPDSLLIIITDGWPDSFETLKAAIHQFPGAHLTFVIGEEYFPKYVTSIGNSLCVEPYTIIKELMYYVEKGGLV